MTYVSGTTYTWSPNTNLRLLFSDSGDSLVTTMLPSTTIQVEPHAVFDGVQEEDVPGVKKVSLIVSGSSLFNNASTSNAKLALQFFSVNGAAATTETIIKGDAAGIESYMVLEELPNHSEDTDRWDA